MHGGATPAQLRTRGERAGAEATRLTVQARAHTPTAFEGSWILAPTAAAPRVFPRQRGSGRRAEVGGEPRFMKVRTEGTVPYWNSESPLPPADVGESPQPQPCSAWRECTRTGDLDSMQAGIRIGGEGSEERPSDADADGANHPIRHWQAMEGDRH